MMNWKERKPDAASQACLAAGLARRVFADESISNRAGQARPLNDDCAGTVENCENEVLIEGEH